jgi:hypothetical protein
VCGGRPLLCCDRCVQKEAREAYMCLCVRVPKILRRGPTYVYLLKSDTEVACVDDFAATTSVPLLSKTKLHHAMCSRMFLKIRKRVYDVCLSLKTGLGSGYV